MIGAIAGQQGFSPDGKTPSLGHTGTGSTTYVTLRYIIGSGVLTSLSLQHNNVDVTLKITIDGVAQPEILSKVFNYIGNLSLVPLVKFESSLLIEGKISAAGNTWLDTCILLD